MPDESRRTSARRRCRYAGGLVGAECGRPVNVSRRALGKDQVRPWRLMPRIEDLAEDHPPQASWSRAQIRFGHRQFPLTRTHSKTIRTAQYALATPAICDLDCDSQSPRGHYSFTRERPRSGYVRSLHDAGERSCLPVVATDLLRRRTVDLAHRGSAHRSEVLLSFAGAACLHGGGAE